MAFGIESTSTAQGPTSGSTLTFSHTVTNANLLLVLVAIGHQNLPTGVTYNGVAMTLVADLTGPGWAAVAIYKLANPATGANNVVVTMPISEDQIVAGATGFLEANSTLGTPTEQSGTTANPSLSVASVADDIVIGVIANDVGPLDTLTADDTLLWEFEDINSDSDFGAQYKVATGTSTTISWSYATSGQSYAAAAVAVSPVFVPRVGGVLHRFKSTRPGAFRPGIARRVIIPTLKEVMAINERKAA